MSREKVVIYTSPIVTPDDSEENPICAIERNGKSFTMYSIDQDTAKIFRDRITKSSAVSEVDNLQEDEEGNTYSTLVKIVGQTFGLITGSTAHNDVTDASFTEAQDQLKVKTTFSVK